MVEYLLTFINGEDEWFYVNEDTATTDIAKAKRFESSDQAALHTMICSVEWKVKTNYNPIPEY